MATATVSIEQEFKRTICRELEIVPEGLDRYIVQTPMTFSDGDTLSIVLKRKDEGWVLTDEGHTFLQLTYELEDADFQQPTRRDIIDRTLTSFGIHNSDGELMLLIPDKRYGDALYNFIQALLRIDDIRYLSRERVKSSFMEDFRQLMGRVATPRRQVTYDWHDLEHDPAGHYTVDCRVNGAQKPLFVFAIPSNEKTLSATVSLYVFERWQLRYRSVGVFEEQEKITPQNVAKFTDICEKTFSNLSVASERLGKVFPELQSA